MSRISAQDIDKFTVLGEFFNRAINSPSNQNPVQIAEGVLANIVAHSDNYLDPKAKNFGSALKVFSGVLNTCISTVEGVDGLDASDLIEELSLTRDAYTNQ